MGDLAWAADRIAIQDCLVRYCRGIDRRDVDLVKSAFWPDAIGHCGGFQGPAQAFAERAVPSLLAQWDLTQHTTFNSSVDLAGDVAHVETYVHAYHLSKAVPDEPRKVFLYVGRYVDRLDRRDGEWRISHRVWVHDFDRTDPIDQAQPEAWVAAFAHGTSDRTDPSFTRA